MNQPRLPAATARYLVAGLVTIGAAAVRMPLVALLPSVAPVYAPFFIAVTVAAWYGGLGPGLFATALSVLLARVLPPHLEATPADALARAAIFVAIAGTFSWFSELLHRSRRVAEAEREGRATSEGRLREALAARARELAQMGRLHDVGNRLVRSGDPGALLLDLVDTAIAVSGADKGNIQLLDGGVLRLAASRGFGKPFLDHFDAVDGACSVCGAAIATGQRILVEDVETSPLFDGTRELEIHREAGVRAVQSTPLFSRRGELVGMLSTHYAKPTRPSEADLHALDLLGRQAADWIDRMRSEAELRAADARKERFLATLSHELRNPLAPLRNALEILRRPDVTPEIAGAARAAMGRQLSHAVRLVDDLLDVSRINRDVLELRLEDCELRPVLAQAIEGVQPFLDAGGHSLAVTLPEEPVVLRGDPARLAQVFGNLLHNACKFSEPGAPVELSAVRSDGGVEVTVRDRGVGFLPADRERIFEMFTQLEPNRARAGGGLGVGLALVRRLVEMHGGRVEASSEGPDRGAVFRVTLPEGRAASAGEPASLRDAAPSHGERRRILVVDDNVDSASSLATLLELSGHEIHTVHDGLSAVDQALGFAPDVVLLDIGLPGIDGYEAARRIRAQAASRSMMLVAVTGWGQEEDRRRSREAGFDHHMVKPLRAAALEQLLATAPRRSAEPARDSGRDELPGSSL
ncbi:MAG TPA: ATP-binding protein [Thermoanaerobaculia bacterium]|jgi:signal transduction histidine kinase/ActR/RegA family two-component response regulator